ncbi:hypothetical protein [Bosea rubneri]|uniref:Uncharacterized protein n=1 Tax=Bosea rubneri TaxID=3075434 RepID=A0ABU3SEE0_9HYPH|nr:hypothetical protein [Bosea sp. ZW T0_25]MDU0343165.1 hypothetical protein [Bosea sp. ZW T0_25]
MDLNILHHALAMRLAENLRRPSLKPVVFVKQRNGTRAGPLSFPFRRRVSRLASDVRKIFTHPERTRA